MHMLAYLLGTHALALKEVVVYTLSRHMPVYYRTFPGNVNDARSLRIIMVPTSTEFE